MPNATGLNQNQVARLAAWNNQLRRYYTGELKLSQKLPGATLPALPGNNAAIARNNKLISQVKNNVNGVPATPQNAAAIAAVATENAALQNVVPAVMKANNNTIKNNGANMRRMFGN